MSGHRVTAAPRLSECALDMLALQKCLSCTLRDNGRDSVEFRVAALDFLRATHALMQTSRQELAEARSRVDAMTE